MNDWDEASILPHYVRTGMMASVAIQSQVFIAGEFPEEWDHSIL